MRALVCLALLLAISAVLAKKSKHSRGSGSRRHSCRHSGSRHCGDDDDRPQHGLPGPSGHPGFPGPNGRRGVQGANGLPGLHGRPGQRGHSPRGPGGPQGEEGPPGRVLPGIHPPPKGARGMDGRPGIQGMPGAKGPPGDVGYNKGDPGYVGLDGTPGHVGVPGLNGRAGLPGFPGETGDPGGCGCLGPDGPEILPPDKDPIAFSGLILGVLRPRSDRSEPLTFDRLTLNIGGGIRSSNTQFTAPVNGVYLFHAVSIGNGNSAAPLVLYRNDTAVMTSGRTDSDAMGMYPIGANDIILELDAGDDVTLQVKPRPGGFMSGVIDLFSSPSDVTFSGFLLRRTVRPTGTESPPSEAEVIHH